MAVISFDATAAPSQTEFFFGRSFILGPVFSVNTEDVPV